MAIRPFGGRTTTYVAGGSEEPPPAIDQELGSSSPVYIRDVVPELTSRNQALRVYEKMQKTDAVVSVSLRASKVCILGAQFYIDPEGDDEQARDIASFVSYNLFEGQTTVWAYTLQKILKMYQMGTSIFEPVYELGNWAPPGKGKNTKQYLLLKKLAYRPTLTIVNIVTDDYGGPQEIVQNAIGTNGDTREVHIPIKKAIIFPYGDADNLWGESILRAAYPHWFYKTHLYKIDGIQKERHGVGVPTGKLPPGYTDDDKKFMQELLQNLRTNEKGYIIQPPGFEMGFAKPEGQLVDVLKSAGYHDVAIMLNVLAEFMMTGFEGSTGGARSSSASQTDIFYKSQWSIGSLICDCFNNYLIPNLVHWNFDTTVVPKMKIRNIGQSRDLQQIAAALGNVFAQSIITPDDETENWVRATIFDMPTRKTPRPNVPPPTPAIPSVDTGTPPGTTPQKGAVGQNGGQGNMGKGPTQG